MGQRSCKSWSFNAKLTLRFVVESHRRRHGYRSVGNVWRSLKHKSTQANKCPSDFGDAYPSAAVTGTDLSPIQPSWVPPNVKFEIDDANLDWTWDDNTFDFIHVRFLAGNIADWSRFYREAFRCCTPGGWIEHQDPSFVWHSDRGIPEDSALDQFPKVFWAGGEKFGRSFRVVEDELQRKGLEAAGFVDVVVRDVHVPVGDWPTDPHQKELGTFAQVSLLSDIEGKLCCHLFSPPNEIPCR